MKTFKRIDAVISVALFVVCCFILMIDWALENLVTCYAIVGGWQVISMVTHSFNQWFLKKNGWRNYYHWFNTVLLISFCIGFMIPPLAMLILYFLLYASPVLAILYTGICYGELKQLRMRHELNLR